MAVTGIMVLAGLNGGSLYGDDESVAGPGKQPHADTWYRMVPKNLAERPAFRFVEDDPALPRVLLIGDSISIGYTEPVRKLLKGKANVHRVPNNAGDTSRGLENLLVWLGDQPWDIIHFNWGLHDLKHVKGGRLDLAGEPVSTPDQYRRNLEELVVRLKQTGARLIWASTTPVPEGAAGRVRGDDVKYNRIAAEVMGRHRVPINDLYSFALPRLAEIQLPRNVHFTDEGSGALGRKVADSILAVLSGE